MIYCYCVYLGVQLFGYYCFELYPDWLELVEETEEKEEKEKRDKKLHAKKNKMKVKCSFFNFVFCPISARYNMWSELSVLDVWLFCFANPLESRGFQLCEKFQNFNPYILKKIIIIKIATFASRLSVPLFKCWLVLWFSCLECLGWHVTKKNLICVTIRLMVPAVKRRKVGVDFKLARKSWKWSWKRNWRHWRKLKLLKQWRSTTEVII